jgi:VanZ family protein
MRTSQKILVALVVLVLYLCLFPWAAKPGTPGPWFLSYWPPGRTGYVDFLLNTFLFVPIGLFAAVAFRGRLRYLRAMALGIGVSFSVEFLQAWLPGRVSSLSDLAANSLGTLLGTAVAPWIARWIHHEQASFRGSRLQATPLLLLSCFAVSQCFPFIPNYRLPHLRHALEALRDLPADPWIPVIAFTSYATIGLLLRFAILPEIGAWVRLLLPLGFLLMRPFFAAVPMTGLEWIGTLGGVAVGAWIRRDQLWSGLFVLLPFLLLLSQLRPLAASQDDQAFRWMPFAALFELSPAQVIRVLAEKFFRYGAIIAVLSRWPLSLSSAALLVTALLAVTEAVQVYVPGRTPETTDPILALIAWALLSASSWNSQAKEALARSTPSPPGSR